MSISLKTFSLALCLGLILWLTQIEATEYKSCMRGDKKPGFYKPLDECPETLSMINRMSLTTEDKKYLMDSLAYVCCEGVSPGMQLLMNQKCGLFGKVVYEPEYRTYPNEVKMMSRPWMALLKFKTKESTSGSFLCGGTLITNQFVLTAAHCVDDNQTELISVRLGEHNIANKVDYGYPTKGLKNMTKVPPVQDFDIEHIIKHEKYSSKGSVWNDIALIKLSSKVNFTASAHIKPICLPVNRKLQQEVEHIEKFRVTGWSTIDNIRSNVPVESHIEIKDRTVCNKLLIGTDFRVNVTSSQICAGGIHGDSCKGDSGGPLFSNATYLGIDRFVQFGIVSYGAQNCHMGYPAVYTNVASYIPWIAEKLYTYNSSKYISH